MIKDAKIFIATNKGLLQISEPQGGLTGPLLLETNR